MDAEAGGDGQNLVTDRAFAGPHAGGTEAKAALVGIQGAENLILGVAGMAETLVGQREAGDGVAAGVGVTQQRQDGVIVGRGAEFDCAARGSRAVSGQHGLQNLMLLAHHKALVFFAETLAFFHQGRDAGIILEELVEPGQLREHLEVAVVALAEGDGGLGGVWPGGAHLLPELAVAGIAADHALAVGLEQIAEGEAAFLWVELGGGLGGHIPEGILEEPGAVVLDLRDQRGHDVEVLVNAGELLQQFDHAVVVLEGVQTHPRQAIFTADQVLVKGLVHVPQKEKSDTTLRHDSR